MKNKILVDEIFGPTIQGEGNMIGMPTVFVRTGGCDYRCRWCDSLHAVLPEYKHNWQKMTPSEVFDIVKALATVPINVTLSGGNPVLHDGLEELIDLGHAEGYTFSIETQGSVWKDWLAKVDNIVCSPKPPSAKIAYNPKKINHFLSKAPNCHIKIVIFDDADFEFAKAIFAQHPNHTLSVSVGNHTVGQDVDIAALLRKMEWLTQKVVFAQLYNVAVRPQLHVLLWGNKRGV